MKSDTIWVLYFRFFHRGVCFSILNESQSEMGCGLLLKGGSYSDLTQDQRCTLKKEIPNSLFFIKRAQAM